jgi:hypothetical protein
LSAILKDSVESVGVQTAKTSQQLDPEAAKKAGVP